MFRLPKCDMPFKQYHERQDYNIQCGKALKNSLNSSFYFSCCSAIATNFVHGIIDSYDRTELIEIPFAGDTKWANRPFGAVNTVQNSGCISFVLKTILDYFGYNESLENILSELETQGYRKWKLANNKKTLSTPYQEVRAIQNEFSNDDPIYHCETLEDIYELYGKPVGIGGAAIAIDNVINYIANRPFDTLDTRIYSAKKVLENLKHGLLVPARVSNSIYHNDDSRTGGHYVILFALIEGHAYVLDSNEPFGIKVLPTSQFFEAVTANESLIAVWDLSCCIVD